MYIQGMYEAEGRVIDQNDKEVLCINGTVTVKWMGLILIFKLIISTLTSRTQNYMYCSNLLSNLVVVSCCDFISCF